MKLQWFSATILIAFHRGVLQLHTEVSGPAPEDAFGSFRVLHQVGAGVLGPVFRAYDPERDRLVAVKLFRLDLPPERVHRLVGELEKLVAAGLTHPSIAAPVETGIAGANAYLAQDYVAADSLDIAIRDEGPAPAGDALGVAARMAAGLDFAADLGIVHGSLHPRDVMLSPDRTRLTGLGIARAVEQAGGVVSMRRPYTAQERIAGGSWDRRADVFSFAALMHEMLWGRRITATGDQAADTLTELAGGDLDRLRAVFACALAEDPAGRYDTALEFYEALASGFPHVVVSTPAPERQALDIVTEPTEIVTEPAERYLDVEVPDVVAVHPVAPPRLETEPSELSVPAALPAESAGGVEAAPFAAFAYEQSRSAVWPLVLALVVGVALGFAGGYGVGVHDRPAATLPALSTVRPTAGSPDGDYPEDVSTENANTGTSAPGGAMPGATPVAGSAVASGGVARAAGVVRAPARVPAASPGSLLVRAVPAGARVFVDGRDYGRAPVTIRPLARGAHRVRVVREGFETEERRVVIPALGGSQVVAMTLSSKAARKAETPKPAVTPVAAMKGAMNIESRPSGASVFVDNRAVGTTPLTIADVAAGTHTVRIELEGYRRWSTAAQVTAGERSRVRASLDK